MSEDGWLRAIRRFSSDGSEASASSLKCFVEFIPVTLDVIRVETPRGYLVVAATDAPLTVTLRTKRRAVRSMRPERKRSC